VDREGNVIQETWTRGMSVVEEGSPTRREVFTPNNDQALLVKESPSGDRNAVLDCVAGIGSIPTYQMPTIYGSNDSLELLESSGWLTRCKGNRGNMNEIMVLVISTI
jgi:hypothetical protein